MIKTVIGIRKAIVYSHFLKHYVHLLSLCIYYNIFQTKCINYYTYFYFYIVLVDSVLSIIIAYIEDVELNRLMV